MTIEKNAQIFIVDDDADDREFIRAALLKSGFEGQLAEFENGQVLFDYLQEHPDHTPDLILLDLNMPVKSGFETLRDLKGRASVERIPIVVFSATTKKEDETNCLKAGCRHFLSKPLDMKGYTDVARFLRNSFFYRQ